MLISGTTVWKWHSTYGVPLEISLDILSKKGFFPVWSEILEAAKKDGANIKRLVEKIKLIIVDVYSPEVAQEILKRLEICLKTWKY